MTTAQAHQTAIAVAKIVIVQKAVAIVEMIAIAVMIATVATMIMNVADIVMMESMNVIVIMNNRKEEVNENIR